MRFADSIPRGQCYSAPPLNSTDSILELSLTFKVVGSVFCYDQYRDAKCGKLIASEVQHNGLNSSAEHTSAESLGVLALSTGGTFGMSFSGNWCGPYTLLPRVMMQGRLYDVMYAFTIISAPAFAAEYGFVGSRVLCSCRPTSEPTLASPYTCSRTNRV